MVRDVSLAWSSCIPELFMPEGALLSPPVFLSARIIIISAVLSARVKYPVHKSSDLTSFLHSSIFSYSIDDSTSLRHNNKYIPSKLRSGIRPFLRDHRQHPAAALKARGFVIIKHAFFLLVYGSELYQVRSSHRPEIAGTDTTRDRRKSNVTHLRTHSVGEVAAAWNLVCSASKIPVCNIGGSTFVFSS